MRMVGLLLPLALVLSAADAADVPPRLPDMGRGPFTVACWVRTSGDGTIISRAPLEGPWAPQGKTLFVRGGKLCFDIGWVGVVTSRSDVADGAWHHVAVAGTGTHFILFVDGSADAAADLAAGPDNPGHALKVGYTSPDFPGPGLTGEVDELYVFRGALSAERIRALADARAPAPALEVAAHWAFEDDARDSSPGRRDALASEGATYVAGMVGHALHLGGAGAHLLLTDPRMARVPAELTQGCESLRAAVEYLRREYGARYPNAAEHLQRAGELQQAAGACTPDRRPSGDALLRLAEIRRQLEALQRQALVTDNPLLDFDQLLFVKRRTYQSNHYYTDFINGCRDFGGDVCVLSLKDGSVRELAPELGGGIFGRFDLDFDAGHVVFDHKRRIGEGFRLWEVSADGSGLRQLTFPPEDEAERIRLYNNDAAYPHHTDDMQPCYLPDGSICLISTRCEFGTLCDAPDIFTTTVLYRMARDGSGMQKLTNSSVSEASPSVMNDGRILYTRWEYVDKGAVCVKCLWGMNPDGSGSYEVFGNDCALPPTLLHGRAIPGANYLFSVLGTPHCPQSGVGTVIRLDTRQDLRTRDPMTYITPDLDIQAEGGFSRREDGGWTWVQDGPIYADPYPLSEAFYLVACNPDRVWNDPQGYGLYLVDEFGNRVPIYRDPGTSCWQPVPLRPRMRPPVIPSVLPPPTDPPQTRGTLVLADVYDGLDGIERGAVKYLRVLEQVPRPWSARRRWDGDVYDQQHAVITKDTHLGLKVLHGVVPVEADGSAHFTVPADRNIYFEALDGDYMELQRMRTYVNLRPGETRACAGCHKLHNLAPPLARPLALRHEALPPGPQPGEAAPRPIHYPTDVQPVLNAHCIRCHGGDDPAGHLDLSGEPTELFCRSYESILARGLVHVIGENHPKVGNAELAPPKTLGAHASKLIEVVRAGHHGVQLDLAEWVRLVTWVDTNAQYYGSYFGRRNLKYRDLPDFRPAPSIASALGEPPN
jgi:hypothetical protein